MFLDCACSNEMLQFSRGLQGAGAYTSLKYCVLLLGLSTSSTMQTAPHDFNAAAFACILRM